jgi:CubicO group peptidase (beta-lactamase class C family)
MGGTNVTIAMTGTPAAGVTRQNLGYLDEHFDRYIAAGKLAGTVTVVFRKGEVAHFSAQGLMDLERGKPMRDDTIFRIYSMTKPIASVALMQLYERGLVQIDDPVHRLIPAWENLRVYATGVYPNFITTACERHMTVRDLLSHQSGLTYGFMMRTNVDAAYRKLGMGAESCGTLQDMVDRLAELPLEFSPGSAWNYSVSTDVVGYLVEAISGLPLDEYLQRNIFEPLGMVDTGFWVRPHQAGRFAANYTPAPSGNGLTVFDDPETSAYLKAPTFFSGGGGLVSTAADYLRFCRMLLGGGRLDGARIIGRKTLQLMTSNHLVDGKTLIDATLVLRNDNSYAGRGFGLGFSVGLDPAVAQVSGSPGDFHWAGAASTEFWVDPTEDLTVIFMTQYMPGAITNRYNLNRELRAIVYGALE